MSCLLFGLLSEKDTGCDHLDVYDTSGPAGTDPRKGLPKLRREWIQRRAAAARAPRVASRLLIFRTII